MIQSILQLPNSRYALSFAQRQRVEHAATTLPAEQRPLFRQRVQQIVATDAMVGLAIGAARRELTTNKAAS